MKYSMSKKISILTALIIVITLGLTAECALSTGEDKVPEGVYSYSVDEFQGGIFNGMSHALTMNGWYLLITYPFSSSDYDSWSQTEKVFIYKDNKLQKPFSGSDLINENSVFYCERSLNGQGNKIGQISGTITIMDIPATGTKVQIRNYSFSQYPTFWWNLYKKINMSSVTGTSATLNWSLPVYENYKPNSENTFELIVLPGNSLNPYTIAVPNKIPSVDINGSVDIGTISIKGVTLSGTININYDGKPVPYLELYATYPVQGTLNVTCLSSPKPNAPWSLTYGENRNNTVGVEFNIMGYSKKNPVLDDLLFDIYVKDTAVTVTNNQSVSGIVIDIGDAKTYQ